MDLHWPCRTPLPLSNPCSPPWACNRRCKPVFIVMNPHRSCGTPPFRELSIDIVESQSLSRNWHQSCRTWVVVAEPRLTSLSPVYCGRTGVIVAESVSLSSQSRIIVIEKVSLLSNLCCLSDLRRRLSNPCPHESVSPSWNPAPHHRIRLLIVESVSRRIRLAIMKPLSCQRRLAIDEPFVESSDHSHWQVGLSRRGAGAPCWEVGMTIFLASVLAPLSSLASSCYTVTVSLEIWENEPQLSSWFVFGTHWMGLTFLGSPLIILLPQFLRQAKMEWAAHIPLERGGADAVGSRSEWDEASIFEPTSLKRGEGPFPGSCMWLVANWGGEGEGSGGGGGMGGRRTNINRDGVDVVFKLRSPS